MVYILFYNCGHKKILPGPKNVHFLEKNIKVTLGTDLIILIEFFILGKLDICPGMVYGYLILRCKP